MAIITRGHRLSKLTRNSYHTYSGTAATGAAAWWAAAAFAHRGGGAAYMAFNGGGGMAVDVAQ